MTHEAAHVSDERSHESRALALLEIADGLADGVHALIPTATAAIAVAIGSEWQLLATRGPIDVAALWPAEVANQVRHSDLPQKHGSYLVAPFSAVGLHALLLVAADSSEQLPRRAYTIVQPVLDAGGILLDRALDVQQRDRAVRRVVRVCPRTGGRPLRTIADLEHTVASLWPAATARFCAPNELDDVSWSGRRLVRVSCDLDQPTIGRSAGAARLMPRDLAYQVAIPMLAQGGALLIEAPAGGEELDMRSLASALALTRDLDVAMTSARAALVQHA